MEFEGKKAIVTGASSGIGHSCAVMLAKRGAQVALISRRKEKLEELLKELPGSGHAVVAADLSEPEGADKAVQEAIEALGGLDILVNNAGGADSQLLLKGQDYGTLVDQYKLNTLNPFACSMTAMEALKKSKGAIVMTSTSLTLTPNFGLAAYAMAKSALDYMTRALALQLAPDGVRVNSVNPGAVATNLHESLTKDTGMDASTFQNQMATFHAMQRIGQSDEVAEAILFLASPKASFITGAVVPVDGGYSLTSWATVPPAAAAAESL